MVRARACTSGPLGEAQVERACGAAERAEIRPPEPDPPPHPTPGPEQSDKARLNELKRVELERGADSPGVKLGVFPPASGPS